MPRISPKDNRPPVAIGHVSLRVNKVADSTDFLVKLGLRSIHESEKFAVLELRGGTHLVLRPTEEPIAKGTASPFDLMVDDVEAARKKYEEAGLNPEFDRKTHQCEPSPQPGVISCPTRRPTRLVMNVLPWPSAM